MGCLGCSVGTSAKGEPAGCGNNGSCGSGSCNRLNTYDWITTMDIQDVDDFDLLEVSFKNGARKSFFRNHPHFKVTTGDDVVVESSSGYDIGRVSLSGELVRMQMKKKRVDPKSVDMSVIRRANQRDMERLDEARRKEKATMIRARAIARTLSLEMKVGDVEFQGDKRKATFYYTADGRVDFRELIRHYAREFKVKIEMRQIGARQESARIGGLGSCGRELCCSTWLTDFKSVSTSAARYQNLAINQAKLSGQCGRLKCCLNYELDTYMDALEKFPSNADALHTLAGKAILAKTDIFKGLMYYSYTEGTSRGKLVQLDIERVKEIQSMNKKGQKPADLIDLEMLKDDPAEEVMDFESVHNVIELPPEKKRSRKKRKGKRKSNPRNPNRSQNKDQDRNRPNKDRKPRKDKNKDEQ